ncbi:MAG: heme biosynthesis HemY N-terminal domain-containing protein [Pseudomonadota bacterium]
MTRAIWFFIKVAILIVVAIWLVDRPGSVEIEWQGRIIEMSVGILLVGILLLMIIAAGLFWLWRNTIRAPKLLAHSRRTTKRAKGYRALTNGLVAVAAGDSGAAQRFAKRAGNLLDEPPLTMLLSAQAAQLNGDEQAASQYFRAMLERDETRFLGLRGLITQALHDGDGEEALRLAHQAKDLRGDTKWVLRTCFELEVQHGDWAAAQATLNQAVKERAIDPKQGKRYRAVVLVERSRAASMANKPRQALSLASEAVSLAPDLIPAVLNEAALLADAGKSKVALRHLERTWALHPHQTLAEAHDRLAPPEADAIARIKHREKLIAGSSDTPESLIALARAEIAAELWGPARSHLMAAADKRPSRLVYRLLADLELADGGDTSASRDWLAKAESAAPDAAWVCDACGSISPNWQALCGNCGAFDTIDWRIPAVDVHALPASEPLTRLTVQAETPPPGAPDNEKQTQPPN